MKYVATVEFIVEGVEACWQNSRSLLEAARQQQRESRHGLALSLAVLSLEEVGKLILIDGLLFAEAGDDRTKVFNSGYRSHREKLDAVYSAQGLLYRLYKLDPRHEWEQRFQAMLPLMIDAFRTHRDELETLLNSAEGMRDLDYWKQRGFYVNYDRGTGQLERPSDVDEVLSKATVQFAFKLVDGIDFLLRENIGRYKALIGSLRTQLTKEELDAIRVATRQMLASVQAAVDGDFVHDTS